MNADTITISGLRAIADRFDHVLLDQWGTLHEGKAIFPAARECVTRLREAGKRVLVLSNSGKRASRPLMANAARSSGLVARSVPFGAFPTAVLTAAAITASFMFLSPSV